ncbi:class I SAM-dependent methyltransferase [Sulfuriflexus mobilis]|uniref:methyltransferase domain-containing protein n=1 Tax=Sulfuriflexus mobilis TaxID=1811807 RepID=UPI001559F198|nr:class I SAM-dependent methyltransferase [Sulfuriflexus mobilis]
MKNQLSSTYDRYSSWKGWVSGGFLHFTDNEAIYYAAELKRAGFDELTSPKCLELGFGNGTFAGWAISQGIAWSGVEVQRELLDLVSARDLCGFASLEEATTFLGTGTIDLVVGFDVFEHLEVSELIEVLKGVYCVLKSGGVLLARVPSGDSPFGRAIFHGDITHRIALGSSAIRQLASQTGFEVIDIGPPRLPIFGVGWMRAMRRGSIRLAQTIIARFINLVFHDGQPCVITANLVFVLKKPVK